MSQSVRHMGSHQRQRTVRLLAGAGITALCAGLLLTSCSDDSSTSASSSTTPASAQSAENLLTAATAWRVTAAENDILYRQGFNVAKDRLDAALAAPTAKPLAIITDIDDTVLSSNGYWEKLIAAGRQSFDDAMWDQFVEANGPTATPGSLEFLKYAASKGVQVFYVSSRDQGDKTDQIGIANLAHVGFPYADAQHVTMLRDSSNKEPAQQAVAAKYDVVAYLGDNLNDFKRRYYVEGVAKRKGLAAEDADEFGRKFILFPNPTDGNWMKAIFGDSEPKDTPEYRETFKLAAEGKVN